MSAWTPGPWAWFGDAATGRLYLATEHSGRRVVMDFVRWGTRSAQPRFRSQRGIMVPANELVTFDVGGRGVVGVDAARNDESVYRLTIDGINHPDARLICGAPDLYQALDGLLRVVMQPEPPPGYVRDDGAQTEAARRALAKARGEQA